MIRSELNTRLAELYPQLHAKHAKKVDQVILDALSNTFSKGGRVEIRGFGSFELIYRPPRQRRNPKTGEKIKVPAN
jgi:integration host factor subunit beta